MSLKFGLLGLLSYGEMTGYALSRTFADSLSHFWQAQTSQIYKELDKMEGEGWLSSHIEIQTEKPNKRIYSITPAGREALSTWLRGDLVDAVTPVREGMLMRLFFSAALGRGESIRQLRAVGELYRGMAEAMEETGGSIAAYGARVGSQEDALYWELTADFGRAYAALCVRWSEDCIKKLEAQEGAPKPLAGCGEEEDRL